mgnify:CR=1 FL=1
MNNRIEEALSALEQEFEDHSYVKENPFGNAGASRKIYDCIIACVKEQKTESECKDLILKVFAENKINTTSTSLTVGDHLKVAIDAIYTFQQRF